MRVFAKDLTHFLALQHLLCCLWGLSSPHFYPFPPELILLRDCAAQGGNGSVDKAGVNELFMMEE